MGAPAAAAGAWPGGTEVVLFLGARRLGAGVVLQHSTEAERETVSVRVGASPEAVIFERQPQGWSPVWPDAVCGLHHPVRLELAPPPARQEVTQ